LGKPAARVGDLHNCPRVSPNGLPHAGGPIVGGGCLSVWIEGRLAATTGDTCLCAGDVDEIKSGSTGVYIEGRPAARQGDWCVHGGVVVGGSGTVFIGERMGKVFLKEPDELEDKDKNNKLFELSQEEKNAILNKAIQDCIPLLERKLNLLECNDPQTMVEFRKWFGRDDYEAKTKILNRIRLVLKVCKILTVENFEDMYDVEKREKQYAEIYPDDNPCKIYLGNKFWTATITGKNSRSGVIVHELSHSNSIGKTFDYARGEDNCLRLAEVDPSDALYNADSFEYFIEFN
jgi:uncharacterized Zn-binding protein involved in type VI secretion